MQGREAGDLEVRISTLAKRDNRRAEAGNWENLRTSSLSKMRARSDIRRLKTRLLVLLAHKSNPRPARKTFLTCRSYFPRRTS